MSVDERTLGDLAREALDVQDASNLSGVVHSWSRSIKRLRELLENEPGFGTTAVNTHPINVLWADKVSDLTGARAHGYSTVTSAYHVVRKLAGGDHG